MCCVEHDLKFPINKNKMYATAVEVHLQSFRNDRIEYIFSCLRYVRNGYIMCTIMLFRSSASISYRNPSIMPILDVIAFKPTEDPKASSALQSFFSTLKAYKGVIGWAPILVMGTYGPIFNTYFSILQSVAWSSNRGSNAVPSACILELVFSCPRSFQRPLLPVSPGESSHYGHLFAAEAVKH